MTHKFFGLILIAAAAASPVPTLAQPASPPACVGTRTFITYFPSGSSEVTASTVNVIKSAASFAGPRGALTIIGHIDASEKDQAALDSARSGAVARSLMDNGLGPNQLTVTSAGATRLAIKTDAPEPLNRRAEICVIPGG